MTLAAMVVLLFPMGFFLLSSPAFLLVRLDIPDVTRLLRGLFDAYFLMTSIAAAIAAAVFAVAGWLMLAFGIAMIAALSACARRWFLRQFDAQLRARDAGDGAALRRLRQLHWEGMLFNAVQLAAIVSSIPYVVAS